ncbi:LIF receptor subunit alpha a [Paramormyrops kingsleyae]|uniref:LIF receptor subunit alpha a n=1 Tax=Paramormyrops kingsleyae TaxID=1676925 RepID=UPI003B97B769
MRNFLLWVLFMTLLTRKGYCQSPHYPAPKIVGLGHNFSSQSLTVTWENDLSSTVHFFDVEVLRTETKETVHSETVAPRTDGTVQEWKWTSPTPLECTPLSVRIRSRLLQFSSEWSEPWNLTGKDVPEYRRAQLYPQDKVVPVGSNTTFCCIVPDGKKFGGIKDSSVKLPFTRISRRSYVSVRINQQASNSSGTNVICLYQSREFADGAVVFVGNPPDPRNLVCDTRDLQSVECGWSLGKSTYLYGSRRTFYSLNERECESANTVSATEHKCRFNITLAPGEQNWTLTARNLLGKVELMDTVDLSHRVRPRAPEVVVELLGAWNASLRWHWGVPWYGKLPLVCQVWIFSDGNPKPTPHIYVGLGLTQALLRDLRPDSKYAAQVRCATQQNFWKWGDWSSEIRFRTKEDRPDPVDFWVQMRSELDRCIVWKPLSKSQRHGQLKGYEVSWSTPGNGVQRNSVPSTGPYHVPIRLEGLSSDYVVTVMAWNNAGDSPAISMTVPNSPEDGDSALSEMVGRDGMFHLSWPPSPNSTCGYVVTWYHMSWEQNCSLDWEKLLGDNSSTRIQSESFIAGERYTFSVYACTPGAPLLLEKRLGYVEEQAPTGTVTRLMADQEDSSVRLSWDPVPLEGQRGFIRGYLIYLYNVTHLQLLENITDPSTMSYTATQLSYATYKFTVKAYTSAGAGKEATVSIKLDPFTDLLIMEILIAAGSMAVLLVLVTALCYSKREWMKKTFYPEIPEPRVPEWKPTQAFGTQTLDMTPCAHSSVHIVENRRRMSGKEELKVVLEDPEEEEQWGNEPPDMDSDEQSFLRYYNQVVGEDPGLAPTGTGSSGLSSRSTGSARTEVTYTGIQMSSTSACSSACVPATMEAPLSGGYRPQMASVPNQAEVSDDPQLDADTGYQPQCSWKLDSPEETSLDSSLGSPTSVNSSQFLLPEPSGEENFSHAPSTTWFRNLLSGSGKP